MITDFISKYKNLRNRTGAPPLPYLIRLDRERWLKVMEWAHQYSLTEDEIVAVLIDWIWDQPRPMVWYVVEDL